MTGLIALLLLMGQESPPAQAVTGTRPEPPVTEEQRRQDALNQPTEGERSTDGATPDRLICDLRRLPGSNLRVRHCSTVSDRRRARSEAQGVLSYGGAPTSSNR